MNIKLKIFIIMLMSVFGITSAISVEAKNISKSDTQTHTVINSDLAVATFVVHKKLSQDYTVVDTNKRKYTKRTVVLWYEKSGGFSPYKQTYTIGYANSNNKIIKEFAWSNYSVLLSGSANSICHKQNSTSVTYSVTNSYKLFASYWLQCYDVAGADHGMGNISLPLNNAL